MSLRALAFHGYPHGRHREDRKCAAGNLLYTSYGGCKHRMPRIQGEFWLRTTGCGIVSLSRTLKLTAGHDVGTLLRNALTRPTLPHRNILRVEAEPENRSDVQGKVILSESHLMVPFATMSLARLRC